MWILYYINRDRINQLSSQIQPEIIKEKTEKKKRKFSANGNAKGSFNLGFISKIFNPSLNIEGSGSTDTELDTEQKIEYNTGDIQLNNVLHQLKKLPITLIDGECEMKNCRKVSGIIRFRGDCFPKVEGDSISERLANYEATDKISWVCKIHNIKVSFSTNKDSLISNTPIHYALSDKNGKLFLDGFGAVVGKNTNSIKIIPIVIGTQLSSI